jgi:hypothetical protein
MIGLVETTEELVKIKVRPVAETTAAISVDFTKTFWIERSQIRNVERLDGELFITVSRSLAMVKILPEER